MSIILMSITVLIVVAPFPILSLFYSLIPNEIPLFVNLLGNPILMTSKSFISVFRLPVMGVALFIVCYLMYSIKIEDHSANKSNKNIWVLISLLGAVKMSLTSLEVFLYQNTLYLNLFRITILIIVIIAVSILIMSLLKMYRQKNDGLIKMYRDSISKFRFSLIILSLIIYVTVVILPIYI